MLSNVYFSEAAKSSKFLILATNSRIFFGLNKDIQLHPLFTVLLLSVLLSFQAQAQLGKRFKLSTGYRSYLLETGAKISLVHLLYPNPFPKEN